MTSEQLDQLSINTIRTLSMDAVQQAKSGHPGYKPALFHLTAMDGMINKSEGQIDPPLQLSRRFWISRDNSGTFGCVRRFTTSSSPRPMY